MKEGEPGVSMTPVVIVASKTSLTVNTSGFGGVYRWHFWTLGHFILLLNTLIAVRACIVLYEIQDPQYCR
jgi:hypothetical protein